MRSKPPHKGGQKDRRHFYPKPDVKRAEKGDRPARRDPRAIKAGGENWLYGLHAVQAALANPRRQLGRAVLTTRAAETIGKELLSRVRVELAEGEGLTPAAAAMLSWLLLLLSALLLAVAAAAAVAPPPPPTPPIRAG